MGKAEPPIWAQYSKPRKASVGRFSEVWDQLNILDSELQPPGKDGVSDVSSEASETPNLQLPTDAPQDSVSVVTMAGVSVGQYDVSAGMTVSTLRDRIALSR